MPRHRLTEASTVELAAAVPAPAVPAPAVPDGGRPALRAHAARDAELDRVALAKELLAAVDDRHAEAVALRAGDVAGDVLTAEPAQIRGRRHRRPPGAHARRHDTEGRPARRRGGRRGRTLLLVTGVAAALLAVPAIGVAAADQCRWQVAAHQLIVSLDGRTDDRSAMLRNALTQVGVAPQLPADCAATATDTLTAARAAALHTTSSPVSRPTTVAAKPTTPPKTRPAPSSPAPSSSAQGAAAARAGTGSGTTAAATFGWGTPVKSDDFTGDLSQWGLYDGAGHGGNGTRSPSAASLANGILTITGDANGTTDGMAWGTGQKYGRWEGRVRAPASDPTYNALLLLWPDADNHPVGGEIDFMEMTDHTRQSTNLFLHYGADDAQVHGEVAVDATQWHNWAVEWTAKGVTTYVDGKPWFHTGDTSILPPGPMHLCIRLDWFPKEGHGGSVRPSEMQVDWVKQYAV